MGGVFFVEKSSETTSEKYVEKRTFWAELGLGGSAWGIGGLEMIARLLGRLWKPSRGPTKK